MNFPLLLTLLTSALVAASPLSVRVTTAEPEEDLTALMEIKADD